VPWHAAGFNLAAFYKRGEACQPYIDHRDAALRVREVRAMNPLITELTQKAAAQAAEIPAMYGRVDFSITPKRFTVARGDQTHLAPEFVPRRPELLANEELVARIKAYTMIGDVVADAYTALMPQHGAKRLITMLEEACEHGVESVPSAPPELVRFIEAMERVPPWLDMKLVEEGARIERNTYAHRAPFVMRGGFIATFMNKYTALPMAMTGTLSNKTAGRRVKETATFFTTSVLPGALDRHGAGFKAAAMVRLMHSMVRFNVLRHGDRWNVRTYGIPIPQVDQMPVGYFPTFVLAKKALREGRTSFTPDVRARVEFARCQCFLLGLPEELLPTTPKDVVDVLLTRHATLRQEFDDTCRELVRATMEADLTPDDSLPGRVHAWLERGFGKAFFIATSMRGDKRAAAELGVKLGLSDYVGAAVAGILSNFQMKAYSIAARIPALRDAADRSLVRKLTRLLASYGHAEFTTNADKYRPAHAS
jgi:ER-bound oxygenase mpaB/B'/Rubber oxygenase, catalytic domain